MRKKHLIIIISIFLGLLSVPAMAANRTFTIQANDSSLGEVRYKAAGAWSGWAASHSVTAADDATVTVEARVKAGNTAYGFSRWDARAVEDIPMYYSAYTTFDLTVTSAFGGKTIFAYFNAWTENLIAGATYTLTSTGGNSFKVTCTNTSSPCHNKTYAFIGNVTVTSGTVKMVYNTNNYLLQTGTIHVKKGKLEMGFGNDATFASNRPTIKRAWGNKRNLILVKPATRAEGDPANVYTDYGLTIIGKESDDFSKNFIITGQYATARMDSTLLAGTSNTYTNYHLVKGNNDMVVTNTLVLLDGGIVKFEYVTVEKTWNSSTQGGIFFGGNGAVEGDKIKLEAELNHCLIQWCYGYVYGAACKVDNYVRGSWVKMTDCEIRYCENGTNNNPEMNSSSGGAIRSSGNNLCSLTMTRCDVHHNCTPARGGGIRWNAAMINPSLVLNNCKIRRNWAGEFGGGLRVEGQADVTGCSFIGNRAEKSGGGLSLGPFTTGGPAHLYVGGGVWFPKDCSISLDSDSKIENNTAAEYGGGIYINVEFTTLEGGTSSGQTFDPWTVYLNDQYEQYKGVLEMNGASVKNNTAGIDGGAVYMTRNTNYYGLVTDLNSGTISNNTAVGNGGAVCLAEDITVPVSPNPTIFEYNGTTYNLVPQNIIANLGKSGGTDPLTITKNTSVNGGGLYVENGNVSVYGNALVGGSTANANKSIGGNGGAVYITGGNLHMYAGEISYNEATKIGNNGGNGGGTFVSGGDVTVESGNINYNKADDQGGGLYSSGVINFSDGSISNNKATQNGGGIYIPATGTLNISGSAALTGNNVTSGQGGGIYLGGTMTADGESLTVSGNTKGTAKAISKNNVYLPDGKTIKVLGSIDPTGVNLGIYTQNEAVEGSADIPVLTADAANVSKLEAIYNALLNGSSQITDDREVHKAKYPGDDATGKTLYFTKISYDFGVFSDSEPFSNPINSPLQLYKYMCWVNGLNGFSTKHAGAEGIVTADINMSGVTHWIPIGEKETSSTDTDPFNGTFNGNGYVISNLRLTGIDDYTNYGLFGNITTNAIITDVNVQGCNFTKNEAGTMGALVGLMQGGLVKNSIASGTLTATDTDCITGGIIGQMKGGTVRSSSAMATMTGYQMGGLVGELVSGCDLYNSFANAQFIAQTSNDKYMGGLAGVNNGKFENCYSRVRGTVPSARFGYLVGNNTATENMGLYYCYSPDATYVASEATEGNQVELYTYNPVIAPYKYYHSNDNTLVSDNSKNLLGELNRWVDGHSGYSPWKRTTAGGYSYTYDDGGVDVTVTGGNINDDYPIHRYKDGSGNDMYKCVASTDGIALDYAATLDAMLTRHTSDATINLYANDNTSKGTGANEVVYIDEDVSLLQSTANAIAAYTGQTLKTYSATGGNRWHLFSSPLKQSQIGISYTDNGKVDFSWAPDPCGVQFSQDNDNALFPGDMPVSAFDLYSFYEPEYHWINFRRNSLSHWHENAHDVQINYNGNGINIGVTPYTNDNGYSNDGNEPILVPGKGYLVSIKQEQLVQNKGVLNNGNVTLQNVTKTNFNAWAGLLGFNLLGNPYQSYLDFEEFVNADIDPSDEVTAKNADNLWTGGVDDTYANTYATYDPAQKAYVQYKSGASGESNTASRYIHPHQGFFVRMTKGSENTNTTTVTYTNNMRVGELPTGATSPFRSDEIGVAFPLINFLVRDSESNGDVAVLELGRTNEEGALKMHLGECTGRISLGYEGDDYGILFRNEVEDYQSLRFVATEAGTFTLTWNTANADFERLTLIDNIAGTETDMLVRDSYRFEATAEQYASRFKVVIGDYKGIDEPEVTEPAEGPAESFAFRMGDQLVVNGAGTLQVIDMMGRVVMTERLTSSQNMVGLPKSTGVYVLRLTDGGGTRTQKIVVGL